VNVFVLVHGPPGTGTYTSTMRVADHLRAAGHQVDLTVHASHDLPSAETFAAARGSDAIVVAHAYYGGRFAIRVDRPSVLILSGTDLNLYANSGSHLQVMTDAVAHVHSIVTYSSEFRDRAAGIWPEARDKIHCIPKGVSTAYSDFRLVDRAGVGDDASVFLLPSGLRAIKDVLYLADTFDAWHAEDQNVYLVIVGVPWDEDYAEMVYRRCAESPGVICLDPLPQPDLHAAMRDAVAVINTSESECCPNAVLEAMHLGVPVMVRNVPGNIGLVTADSTGIVFDSLDEFEIAARRLVAGPTHALRLGQAGKRYARSRHALAAEQKAYAALVSALKSSC
jgi:glycosyltransferase involved in cell wall biosynthesis